MQDVRLYARAGVAIDDHKKGRGTHRRQAHADRGAHPLPAFIRDAHTAADQKPHEAPEHARRD